MKKKTLEHIIYLVLISTLVGGWLWYQYAQQEEYPFNSLYAEQTDNFLRTPQKGDLYVLLNKENQIIEYFKIIRQDLNGQLELAIGPDTAHFLTSRHVTNPNWVIDRLEEDISSWEVLTIKSIQALNKEEVSLKTFSRYQTLRVHVFRNIIFSSWGLVLIVILSFFLIWGGRSLSDFLEAAYSIKKEWVEIGPILLLFLLLNPFKFNNWLFEVFFCLLSTIPVYLLVQKRIKHSVRTKESIGDKEVGVITRIMFFGWVIQFLALWTIGVFSIKYWGGNLLMDNKLYFKMAGSGIAILWTAIALGNLINNIRKYFMELSSKDKQLLITQLQAQQSKAELDALQSKVNPHFLYNSLNSIAGLAQEDPQKTEEMAIALSHFYKQSTNRKGEHWNTISEAIEVLKTYLEIEKIRFGERLQFEISCPDEAKEEKIPRFLMQPLVENAIKFGYQSETNSIHIRLVIERVEEELHIRIYDQGQPFPENLQSGYGVQSVQKKLELLYPEKHELAFVNAPEKHVLIKLQVSDTFEVSDT